MKRFAAITCFATICALSGASQSLPQYLARQDYVGLYSYYVAAGDVNGDGISDLVGSNQGNYKTLLGNGDGTFRTGPTGNTAILYSQHHSLADVNGDGYADLVLAGGSNTQGGIGVSLAIGDGSFQRGYFHPAGDDPGCDNPLAIADFNSDGKPDVAVTGSSGAWLFLGNGDGTFQPAMLVLANAGATQLATGDFNGDGRPDLVVVRGLDGNGAGFDVMFGNGNGSFQTPVSYQDTQQAFNLTAGNFFKGGLPGFAITTENGSNPHIYRYSASGTMGGPFIVSVISESVAVGDVNGDGYPDVVADNATVAFGAARNPFTATQSYPALTEYNVAVADLLHNGKLDIITDSYNGISVLLNEGGAKFQEGNYTTVSGGVGCTVSADFNRDGFDDLATTSNAGITILLGTGSTKRPLNKIASGVRVSEAGCPIVGDLNGDSIPDLLVPTPTGVVPLIGNGDGTFQKMRTVTTSAEGYLAIADFNHDHILDFATSANQIAYGRGDGTFGPARQFIGSPPSGGFTNIAVGDLNNDGWPDLMLVSANFPPYTNAYVLLNNQHGGFRATNTGFGETASQVILSDLNHDGNLDAVLVGALGNETSFEVFLGNGTGSFGGELELIGLEEPGLSDVTVADVNGDAIPDVIVQAGTEIGLFLGVGDGTFVNGPVIGAQGSPDGVLAVNLHGAAKPNLPDLVVPDINRGMLVAFSKAQP